MEEQGETAPHQAPEHISNQLYGKYKEIKVGILLNCSNKYLGMKLYSVYWESSLLSGYFCRMSASALGGGLPVAHVNSPAVYPVSPPPAPHCSIYARVSAPGCSPWLLGCAHLISAPKPG